MDTGAPSKSVGLRVAISVVLIAALAAVGVGGFLFLLSQRKTSGRHDAVPPRTAVRVEAAQRGDHQEHLTGYGRARALRTSIVAAEVAGVVRSISERLEAGSTVAAGEELVRLDDRDYRAALERAEASLAQAEAGAERQKSALRNIDKQLDVTRSDLETAQREYERMRDLARAEHASASELDAQQLQVTLRRRAVLTLEERADNARADLLRADAEIAGAAAQVKTAQLDVERTIVRAPYAGEIAARFAQLGSRVAPGAQLFRIVDTSEVEVPVSLPASRFGDVRVGAPATIRLTESGPVVWEGTVARVAPGVDAQERTFEAYLVVTAKSANPVPPGAFVVATLDGRMERDVFVLPRVAFVGERVYVAVASDDGEDLAVVRERTPHVRRMLASVALVDGGVEPGEEILVTSVDEVADGTRVRVVRDAAGADR